MEAIKGFFGGISLADYLVSYLFVVIGVMIFKALTYNKRTDKHSPFNIYYWWSDNKQDFILGVLLAFLAIRFFNDLIIQAKKYVTFLPDFLDQTLYMTVLGLGMQMLIGRLRKWFGMRRADYASGESRYLNRGSIVPPAGDPDEDDDR